eukprot:3370810-Amphidinium_carterae.1
MSTKASSRRNSINALRGTASVFCASPSAHSSSLASMIGLPILVNPEPPRTPPSPKEFTVQTY